MEAERVDKYWRAITAIEAREALLQLKIAEYPDLKSGAKEKLRRRLLKDAYPNQKSYTTFEDLQQRLTTRG